MSRFGRWRQKENTVLLRTSAHSNKLGHWGPQPEGKTDVERSGVKSMTKDHQSSKYINKVKPKVLNI